MAKKRAVKKRPKKSTAVKEYPKLIAFVFCDAVGRDPNNNKVTLYGLYDKFALEDIPGQAPMINGYAKLEGGTGEHEIYLAIKDPDGEMLNAKDLGSFKCDMEGHERVDITMQFRNIQFSKKGRHLFTLKSGNKVLGPYYPLEILKVKKR